MQKILILGGTKFIGRNLVEQLQKMGRYELTLFNRQQSQADLFPSVKKIKGDRETDSIQQIADENWDYVIDLSCYYPQALVDTLRCLPASLKKYLFISTCSVYDNQSHPQPLKTETTQILECDEQQRIDRSLKTYGRRKAECERILQTSGLKHLIFRPSLVYGKYDYTNRFYYWLHQVKERDLLLLPDGGERTFSITHVEDLVNAIILGLTTHTRSEVYNVITLPRVSIRQIVDCAADWMGKTFQTVDAAPDFLLDQGIDQWTDMPLWINGDFFTYSNQQLLDDFAIDLSDFRQSVRESINYYQSLGWPEPGYGMTEQKRQELLDKINQLNSQKTPQYE